MPTLPKLQMFVEGQFAEGQLDDLIVEGVGNSTVKAWVDGFLSNIAGMVKKTPEQYLSFGPMWWPIKAMMQERGLLGGETVDSALIEQATLGKPELDVAAAFAFHDWYQGGNVFTCETADGDTVDYELVDEDFEGV